MYIQKKSRKITSAAAFRDHTGNTEHPHQDKKLPDPHSSGGSGSFSMPSEMNPFHMNPFLMHAFPMYPAQSFPAVPVLALARSRSPVPA
jgi:hypothetical protein